MLLVQWIEQDFLLSVVRHPICLVPYAVPSCLEVVGCFDSGKNLLGDVWVVDGGRGGCACGGGAVGACDVAIGV